jgi:hypothetical protein
METNFFDFIEVVSQEELLNYLVWGESKMWEQIRLKGDAFSWMNGVHYFQQKERGKVTFNKRMIEVWLTAKCQNNEMLHLNAVQRFQELHPGSGIVRRGKGRS